MEVGQRIQKVDCPRLVFEVKEERDINGLPHYLVARIDWPEDRRIFSQHTLSDKRYFKSVH